MAKINIRWILYPVIGIGSYFFAKRFLPTEEDRKERLDKRLKPPIEDPLYPEIIKDPLHPDIRGGFLDPEKFFIKFFQNNAKYILIAVFSTAGIAIGDRWSTALNEIIKEASPAIAALPVPLAKRLLEGLGGLNSREILSVLKEGLMSKELTLDEKLSLLKKSIVGLIISAKSNGMKQKLILTVLIIICSVTLANGPLFGGAILVFQDLFTKMGFKKATVDYIISIYQDYNAPIPKELADLIKKVSSESVPSN